MYVIYSRKGIFFTETWFSENTFLRNTYFLKMLFYIYVLSLISNCGYRVHFIMDKLEEKKFS